MAKVRIGKDGVNRGEKTDDATIELRIATVQSLVNQGETKGAIKQFCREEWGVHWRTAENYFVRARNEMLKDAGTDRQTLLAESKGFWSEMLRKGDATNADKMRARENLDKLFALSQISVKVEHSGTIEHAASSETLEAIASKLMELPNEPVE